MRVPFCLAISAILYIALYIKSGFARFRNSVRRPIMASLVQRGDVHYIQFRLSGKLRRISTQTDSLQIAKEKLRQFESSQMRGDLNPLPTKTPIADVVNAYVEQIRTVKTAKSA